MPKAVNPEKRACGKLLQLLLAIFHPDTQSEQPDSTYLPGIRDMESRFGLLSHGPLMMLADRVDPLAIFYFPAIINGSISSEKYGGFMDRTRLLELALEELQRQRASIEAEIASITEGPEGTTTRQTRSTPTTGTRRGRRRTAAQRKAQAQKMRQIWAARRSRAVKPAPAANVKEEKAEQKSARAKAAAIKTSQTIKAKTRSKTAAQKKALSQKMREVWKRRKAAKSEAK
jgi:hypothetical protein